MNFGVGWIFGSAGWARKGVHTILKGFYDDWDSAPEQPPIPRGIRRCNPLIRRGLDFSGADALAAMPEFAPADPAGISTRANQSMNASQDRISG